MVLPRPLTPPRKMPRPLASPQETKPVPAAAAGAPLPRPTSGAKPRMAAKPSAATALNRGRPRVGPSSAPSRRPGEEAAEHPGGDAAAASIAAAGGAAAWPSGEGADDDVMGDEPLGEGSVGGAPIEQEAAFDTGEADMDIDERDAGDADWFGKDRQQRTVRPRPGPVTAASSAVGGAGSAAVGSGGLVAESKVGGRWQTEAKAGSLAAARRDRLAATPVATARRAARPHDPEAPWHSSPSAGSGKGSGAGSGVGSGAKGPLGKGPVEARPAMAPLAKGAAEGVSPQDHGGPRGIPLSAERLLAQGKTRPASLPLSVKAPASAKAPYSGKPPLPPGLPPPSEAKAPYSGKPPLPAGPPPPSKAKAEAKPAGKAMPSLKASTKAAGMPTPPFFSGGGAAATAAAAAAAAEPAVEPVDEPAAEPGVEPDAEPVAEQEDGLSDGAGDESEDAQREEFGSLHSVWKLL